MIDTLANLLFRCAHRRLTRPVTPVSKAGVPHGQTYVVCLDCGKQFAYDVREMRMGKPIPPSHEACFLPPNMPKPRKTLKYALLAALPLAVLAGVALKKEKAPKPAPPKPRDPGAA